MSAMPRAAAWGSGGGGGPPAGGGGLGGGGAGGGRRDHRLGARRILFADRLRQRDAGILQVLPALGRDGVMPAFVGHELLVFFGVVEQAGEGAVLLLAEFLVRMDIVAFDFGVVEHELEQPDTDLTGH